MRAYLSSTIFLLLAILSCKTSFAQVEDSLRARDSSTIHFLNSWLKDYHLDTIIHLTSIQDINDKISVTGTIPGKNSWGELHKQFDAKNEIPLEEFLFRKIAFQFKNIPTEVSIELEGKNAYVFITGSDTSAGYDLQMKMASISDSFYIPIKEIKTIGERKDFETKNAVIQLQNKIIGRLKPFFYQYKFEKVEPEYTPIPLPYKNELIINVRKIKKAALERPVSWEKYVVVIKFRKNGQKLLLHMNVDGAFGPGIGTKEALNYYDLQQYHSEAMSLFTAKIISEIQQLFTSL